MSKNFVHDGKTTDFTAGANILSGGGVILGTILGIAHADVANGEVGVAHIEGVWEMKKLSTAVIAQGAKLTWDVSAGEFIVASAVSGDLENCAVAVEAAGNGVTTVLAKLCPGCGALAVGDPP